jgi:imidazolonepropionase-like amidohydrolase
MRNKRIVNYLLLLCVLLRCASAPMHTTAETRRVPPRRVAIHAARLLDVEHGRIINDAMILIEGEKITAAGTSFDVPRGTQLIELGNVTLLPGLIDAHTHITYHFDETGHFGLSEDASPDVTLRYAAENARSTLNAGYTTIRNLGAGDLVDIKLRDAINRGELVGPTMLVSGLPLLPTDIPQNADKPARIERIREFVRARIGEGVDVIKIFNRVNDKGEPAFNEEEIRAAVEEAGRAGRRVAVHAHEAAAVKAATRGGCASIEHGSFLDDEAIRLLVKHHTALVPTLYLPNHYLEHKSQFAFGDATWEFFKRLRAGNLDNARRAWRSGVLVVSGSDAVAGLHGQNAREPEWLTKAGLTPLEALRAATIAAARLLGIEGQTGEIKAGKMADIIAVRGDPTREITSLERVVFVMKKGQVVKDEVTQKPAE